MRLLDKLVERRRRIRAIRAGKIVRLDPNRPLPEEIVRLRG